MKWFVYSLIILLIIIIDQSVFNVFHLGLFTPDLLLLFALAVVWSFNNFDFFIFATLGGFWIETMHGLPVGSLVLSLVACGSLAYLVINRWLFSEKSWQYIFAAVVIGTMVIHGWLWAYISFLEVLGWSHVAMSTTMMFHSLLPALIVNLILTYPVLVLVELVAKVAQKSSRSIYKL